MMKLTPVHSLAAALLVAGLATGAAADSCSNSCVIMTIPNGDGVYSRLDGSADAVLWPPSQALRRIPISALNDRSKACDVTVHDVRQNETPGSTSAGRPIDDAANCSNEGHDSFVDLRSTRQANGEGRSYHIAVTLADPDCDASTRPDDVLVVVPRDDAMTASTFMPDEEVVSALTDESSLRASYAGDELRCQPDSDDRIGLLSH